MMEREICKLDEKDYLKFGQNDKILKLENGEKILLSCTMVKINKKEKSQSRNFLLTSKRILNVSKKIKRSIDLASLAGISLSQESFEFVIHVQNDYDYRYVSEEYRDQVLFYVLAAYNNSVGKDLSVFVHRESTLQHCCTLESDRDKKRSKIPVTGAILCSPTNLNIKIANLFIDQAKGQRVVYIKEKSTLVAWIKHFIPDMKISQTQLGSKYHTIYYSRCALRGLQHKHFAVRTVLCQNEEDRKTFVNRVMLSVSDQFVVPLEFCFIDGSDVYLVMTVLGNDLYQRLCCFHNLSESSAKYYFAQVLCGLQLYHEQLGIYYGELKPENVLLDEMGRVFLTGYRSPSRKVAAETLEYSAPELLLGEQKTIAADFWCLGIFLYELLVGIPPFYYENQDAIMIELILENIVQFPKFLSISMEAQNMILSLLKTNKDERLGMKGGIAEIKKHPWLANIDWKAYEKKEVFNQDDTENASSDRRIRIDYTPLEPNEPTYLLI